VQQLLGTIVGQRVLALTFLPNVLLAAYFRRYLLTQSAFHIFASRFTAKNQHGHANQFCNRERAFFCHLFIDRSAPGAVGRCAKASRIRPALPFASNLSS
jgi:hypothetical protein